MIPKHDISIHYKSPDELYSMLLKEINFLLMTALGFTL